MEIEKKISEFKALSRVVQKAEFQNIFLVSSEVWRSLDAIDYEYNKVRAEISFKGFLLEDHKERFLAKVEFSIKGVPEEVEDDTKIIGIESEYILTYSVTDRKGLTKKDIETFCNMNAIYNAWPYCREYIQSMTNRMEIPPLILPLLKFRVPSKKGGGKTKTTKQYNKSKA